MRRAQEPLIISDLANKMVLLSGPRQCGKTTLSKQLKPSFDYFNYDVAAHRKILLAQEWDRTKELLIFDELHKMRYWKL